MKKYGHGLLLILLTVSLLLVGACDDGGSDDPDTDSNKETEETEETDSLIGQSGTDIGPVDIDGDGVSDGIAIDTDGDGTPDGVDTDGDGKIDQEYSDEYELLLTDAEAVTADAAALGAEDITFSGSDSASSVTGSFTLPTSGSSGSTISWTSGNQIVQIAGTSASLSPEAEQTGFGPYTVTLTATVSKGDESTTKDISLTVYPPATTKIAASADGITFKMVIVPGGLSFKTNDGDNNNGLDDATASVSDAYWIADTEVTYELWSAVYTWATSGTGGATGEGAYTFGNAGVMGDGSGDTNQHPVTTINWRDALVWCNALTEWYNANNGTEPDLDLVYYTDSDYKMPLRTSTNDDTDANNDGILDNSLIAGSEDKPYIKASANDNTDMANCTATGFRLPNVAEWSAAARYKGSDSSNDAYEYPADSGNYWTPGDYASGATADHNNATETKKVGWYFSNSGSSTHVVGTAGNSESAPAVRSGDANALGLYDMSGNVYEWNFDWHPLDVGSDRVLRGGSWNTSAGYMRVGYWGSRFPYFEGFHIGFRFTRTQ